MSIELSFVLVIMCTLSCVVMIHSTFIRAEKIAGTSADDERLMNDDFIIPKSGPPCPDDDQPDCSADVHTSRARDSLIYPATKVATRRPLQTTRRVPTTRSTMTSSDGLKQSPVSESDSDQPCQQSDDEDCNHASGGDPPLDNAHHPATMPSDRLRTPPTTYFRPISPPLDGGDRWVTAMKPHIIYHDTDSGDTQTKRPEVDHQDDSLTPDPSGGAGREHPSATDIHADGRSDSIGGIGGSIQRSSTTSVGNYQLRYAMHMNMILIIGIAAGIVILLLILIIAVCKYNGRGGSGGTKGGGVYKVDRGGVGTKGYAYEACNTLPPHGTVPLLPSELSTTACASSYLSAPAPMTVLHAGVSVGISTSAATLPLVKPAKKDVKEWYV